MTRRLILHAPLRRLAAAVLFLAVACTGDVGGPERRKIGIPELSTVGAPAGGGLGQQGGTALVAVFNPNPHRGDAIIATFFWMGANSITSVTDRLDDGSLPGNSYALVELIQSGGISMATYVATNAQNFPDASTSNRLIVQANVSSAVQDGGGVVTAWTGVEAVQAQAVGQHLSAAGSGPTNTIADPGSIGVGGNGVAYAVTLSNALVPVDRPDPTVYTQIGQGSDTSIKNDIEYALPASAATTVHPQWTWHFNSQSTWLATVLALNPTGGSTPPPP
ncbi:MAG TPA: hypothetical protein VF926_04280, partial [Mycobacterium sp.]